MAKREVVQASGLLNTAYKQATGQEAPTILDIRGLFDMGEVINSSTKMQNVFIENLTDLIRPTMLRTLDVDIDFPNLMVTENEFEHICRKISFKTMEAIDDLSYNVSDENFETNIFDVHIPEVIQTLFTKRQAFVIPLTISTDLLISAFNSVDEMDNFIAGIFDMVRKSVIMRINVMQHLGLCNLIAEKAKSGKVINLKPLVNTMLGTSYTASQIISMKETLRATVKHIMDYIKYIELPSTLFNDGTVERATIRDNAHVLMLQDFVSRVETVLQSDSFNEELVALPNYSSVAYWQNTGNTLPISFDTVSTVNVIPSSSTDNTAIEVKGVIGAVFDRQAFGTSILKDWSEVDRNGRNRYMNYTFGATRGYYNDLSENVIIFAIYDEE